MAVFERGIGHLQQQVVRNDARGAYAAVAVLVVEGSALALITASALMPQQAWTGAGWAFYVEAAIAVVVISVAGASLALATALRQIG